MRFRVEGRPPPIAAGVSALLAGLGPRGHGLLPQIQLPLRVDPITGVLGAIVCVGPVVIVLLIIAFIRAGTRPQRPAAPEEAAPAGVSACPRCGHM